jgi:hypothetical protein
MNCRAVAILHQPEPKAKPEDPKQGDPVKTAVAKAIGYLRQEQAGAQWLPAQYEEGATCLALLALLRSGVGIDDLAIAKALTFVRKLQTDNVYTLSLQTAVLGQVHAKEDAVAMQANVDRLLASVVRDPQRRFTGWTYRTGKAAAGVAPDNSNTAFAVLALDAASAAGAKIDQKIWQELQDFYLRRQRQDGGWGYVNNGDPNSNDPNRKSTFPMTCHAVSGLIITRKHCTHNAQDLDKRILKGRAYIIGQIMLIKPGTPISYYALYAFSRARRILGKAVYENDREVTLGRILNEQRVNGSWRGERPEEKLEVIATSFAVLSWGELKPVKAEEEDGATNSRGPQPDKASATGRET